MEDKRKIFDIELTDGEEVAVETFIEFSNGKGDDEDEQQCTRELHETVSELLK